MNADNEAYVVYAYLYARQDINISDMNVARLFTVKKMDKSEVKMEVGPAAFERRGP